MMRAIAAGAVYFLLVFALGFALGTLRTLFVADAPGKGRLLGVLIELPIMLITSWLICAAVIRRLRVPADAASRLLMGGIALLSLLLAEMLVGVLLFDRTPAAHFALYREASYALGLAAQIAFAAFPVIQGSRRQLPLQSNDK